MFTTSNSILPTNAIGTIVIDTNNIKWIGTFNGALKIEGSNWQLYDSSNTPFSSSSIYPRDIDKFNNVWVTAPTNGIGKFDGITWTVYDTTNSGLPNNSNATISVDENNVKWIGTPGLVKFDDINWTIYRTTNSGLPNNVVTTVAFENHIKWVGTFSLSGGMAKFNDTNWIVYNTGNSGLPSNTIEDIRVDAFGNKWICTYAGGLAKFNSLLNSWIVFNPSNSGLPSYYTKCIAFKNTYIKLIGTEGAGFAIFNDTIWQVYNSSNSPLPSNTIFDIEIDKLGNVWLATLNGLVVFNSNNIIGINNESSNIPKSFRLYQNFPNPFNSNTIIEYEISKKSNVKISIFNITGKTIDILVDKMQNTGKYKINYSANNLSSGVYFYRLQTQNDFEVKKFVLVK